MYNAKTSYSLSMLPPFYYLTFLDLYASINTSNPLRTSLWRVTPTQVHTHAIITTRGYSSFVPVGMCHYGIWKQTHTNINFSRKSDPFIYQLNQFCAKFWAKSPDFSQIFLNLSQFWLKFRKILKNWPILMPNFVFYKRSFIYQEADFATHVGGTSP